MTNTNLIERLRETWLDTYWHEDGNAMLDEAAALIEQQEEVIASLVEALKNADQFMTNGIELRYIRLPTAPDSALLTPGVVRAALISAKTHLDRASS